MPRNSIVSSNGTNTCANGLVIMNSATLAGMGLIQGNTTIYGTNAPGGTGSGTITNSGNLTLQASSVSVFGIATNTTPGAGWNYEVVTNRTLTLGGTLIVQLNNG